MTTIAGSDPKTIVRENQDTRARTANACLCDDTPNSDARAGEHETNLVLAKRQCGQSQTIAKCKAREFYPTTEWAREPLQTPHTDEKDYSPYRWLTPRRAR